MAARRLAPRKQIVETESDDDESETECSSDSSGWETDSSDGSIPDPDELMNMPNKGPGFDWKRVSKVIKRGICWKCLLWSPYYTCKKCGRHFHRECAFMEPEKGYPLPIFDHSSKEACLSSYRQVELLKCPVCIISEETCVTTLRKHTKKELNAAFSLVAKYLIFQYGEILADPKLQTDNATHITLAAILEKTINNEYLTAEGFYNDYKMIQYNLVFKFGRESEANDTVRIVLNRLNELMKVVISCLGCVMKAFDDTGKLFNLKEYQKIIREPCSVPHPLVWVKEVNYPFWPAKVLHYCSYKKTLTVQYFGERFGAKELPFPGNGKKICYKAFSSVYPQRRPDPKGDWFSKWEKTMTQCNGYLKKLREKYGEDGVVIPKEAGNFRGNLDEYIRQMFPKYVAEKPAEGPVGVGAEASVDKLQLGSVEIETDNDLHVQAEDDLVPALPEEKEGVE